MNNTKKLLESIIEGMTEKKAERIVKVNFAEIENTITDFFIICEATTDKQVKAISDSIEEIVFKKTKEKPLNVEGKDNSEWIILDYFDIIVHVFKKDFRELYNLEDLWADAQITKIDIKYSSLDN